MNVSYPSIWLPLPTSVNNLWRSKVVFYNGKPAVQTYKTHEAVLWSENAALMLQASGYRALPPLKGRQEWWIEVRYLLWAHRLDVDAANKLLLDTLLPVLGITDYWVARCDPIKVRVDRGDPEGMELSVEAVRVVDKSAWNALSLQRFGVMKEAI